MTKINTWKNWNYYKPLMALLYSSIFTITLTGILFLSNVVFPYPNIPDNLGVVSLKLQYFAEHKDEYNTIFLGPSTTYRSIVPNLFDKFMADQDWEIKSFNFGINGAIAADTDFYLRKIIALKPANLKWLFIEYNDRTFDRLENANSARSIYWHTPRQTLLNFRLILEAEQDLKYKFFAAYANFKSFFCRNFWIGRFANWWQEKVLGFNLVEFGQTEFGKKEIPDASILAQQSGYYALDWQTGGKYNKRHQYLLDNLDNYYEEVDKIKEVNTSKKDFKTYSFKVLENMCNQLKNQGIKPLLFITPILKSEASTTINLYKHGDSSTLFAFNNPETFPNLYQVNRRFDFLHLNDQGAKEFTHSLAEQFAKYLETQQDGFYGQSQKLREELF
ncbi:MAG: hypothetical protein F6K54_34030 [Okeania sp. SIO3B5]|uniref:hypothetical protein n=1 Tax=Okeania sp. SIO3B5 TaxID=2607811 RepID=UPI001400EF8C|nr:hypothetical protein [Okeania sp. SIO3B5]NEO57648.1 hypothetical protein [Okeania sp. SIO3B5]